MIGNKDQKFRDDKKDCTKKEAPKELKGKSFWTCENGKFFIREVPENPNFFTFKTSRQYSFPATKDLQWLHIYVAKDEGSTLLVFNEREEVKYRSVQISLDSIKIGEVI